MRCPQRSRFVQRRTCLALRVTRARYVFPHMSRQLLRQPACEIFSTSQQRCEPFYLNIDTLTALLLRHAQSRTTESAKVVFWIQTICDIFSYKGRKMTHVLKRSSVPHFFELCMAAGRGETAGWPVSILTGLPPLPPQLPVAFGSRRYDTCCTYHHSSTIHRFLD